MSPPSTSACQAVALGLGHSVVPRRGTCSIRAFGCGCWLTPVGSALTWRPSCERPDRAAALRGAFVKPPASAGGASAKSRALAPKRRSTICAMRSLVASSPTFRERLPCAGRMVDHRVELGRVQIDAPQIGLPRPASQQDCLFVGMQLTTDRHFAASWRSGCGAPGETRTHDLLVRNQMLYPLSYGRP